MLKLGLMLILVYSVENRFCIWIFILFVFEWIKSYRICIGICIWMFVFVFVFVFEFFFNLFVFVFVFEKYENMYLYLYLKKRIWTQPCLQVTVVVVTNVMATAQRFMKYKPQGENVMGVWNGDQILRFTPCGFYRYIYGIRYNIKCVTSGYFHDTLKASIKFVTNRKLSLLGIAKIITPDINYVSFHSASTLWGKRLVGLQYSSLSISS